MFAVSCHGVGPPLNQDGKSPASRSPGLASLTQAGCELWTMRQARGSRRPPSSLMCAQTRVPTREGRRLAPQFTDIQADSQSEVAFPSPMTLFLSAGVWDQKAGGVGAGPHLPTPGAASALGGERSEGQTMPRVGLPRAPTWNLSPAWPDLAAQHCAPGPQEAGLARLPSLPPGTPPRGPAVLGLPGALHCPEAQPAAPECAGGKEAPPCRGLWGLGPTARVPALSASAPTVLPLTKVE